MIPYERKERYTVDDLAEIISLLRSKEGCPWDREQTHESIRSELIEETYEVIEAIDQKDPAMLREELGDLLLQVVFHAQIEQEQAHFTLEDVCTEICEKMIVRHPHVFSTVQADTTEDVLKNWDTIKEETKHQTTRTETLEAVAKTLPALMRAQKVSKRAAKGKGHFLCKESALASVTECKHTLEQAVYLEDKDELTRAMGEMLFCCASAAQPMRLDKYLKVSRLIKRRTVANEACDAGKVLVNEKIARASYDVKVGDVIAIQMGQKELSVRVEKVPEFVTKEDAVTLYTVLS